mgnify:FL=1|tara:strand:- start:103 stop:240 length:138 start_codon:yes stop_codon:yes gene_type:complete
MTKSLKQLTENKINAARARIIELKILINLWEKQEKSTKTSNSSYI